MAQLRADRGTGGRALPAVDSADLRCAIGRHPATQPGSDGISSPHNRAGGGDRGHHRGGARVGAEPHRVGSDSHDPVPRGAAKLAGRAVAGGGAVRRNPGEHHVDGRLGAVVDFVDAHQGPLWAVCAAGRFAGTLDAGGEGIVVGADRRSGGRGGFPAAEGDADRSVGS